MAKELKEGQSVYQLIETRDGDLYLMEGVIVAIRRVEHPDPDDPYFPEYVEVDVQWIAGAPADVVERWGLDKELSPDRLETDLEEVARKHIAWVTNTLNKRVAEHKQAKAEGRLATYPCQPEEDD